MFCPKCRDEYRDGYYECADCRVPLVPELPLEPKPEFVDFQEILTTFSQTDIAIIRSVLDDEGLTYFLKGEHFNQIRPMVEPVRLMVREDEAQKARALLNDINLQYSAVSTKWSSDSTDD